MTEIPTQPSPENVTRAADLIEAILLSRPDIEAQLALGAALATLLEVYPPYPPTAPVTEPISMDDGLPLLREALLAAAEEARSVQDVCRIALAGCELRPLQ